jgi:hypothetical protein
MKRVILLVIAIALVAGQVWAGPAFGIKGGLNLANVSEDPAANGVSYGIRTGIAVGGNIEFALTPSNNLTIRGEAMYEMKGTKTSGTIQGVDWKGTVSVDEIVLAPFLVIRFPSQGFTPFLQAGPELGLNVTHKVKTEATGYASSTDDLKDWSGVNFGLNIGAGIALPAGNGEVIFDARYNLGLKNMYTGSESLTDKTNGIQLLIGYNFKVPTK